MEDDVARKIFTPKIGCPGLRAKSRCLPRALRLGPPSPRRQFEMSCLSGSSGRQGTTNTLRIITIIAALSTENLLKLKESGLALNTGIFVTRRDTRDTTPLTPCEASRPSARFAGRLTDTCDTRPGRSCAVCAVILIFEVCDYSLSLLSAPSATNIFISNPSAYSQSYTVHSSPLRAQPHLRSPEDVKEQLQRPRREVRPRILRTNRKLQERHCSNTCHRRRNLAREYVRRDMLRHQGARAIP